MHSKRISREIKKIAEIFLKFPEKAFLHENSGNILISAERFPEGSFGGVSGDNRGENSNKVHGHVQDSMGRNTF